MGRAGSAGANLADRPRTARAHSRRLRDWIPQQHGVWAMLLLPYLAGLQHGADWLDAPLLVGWVTGWLMSHHALLAVKTGRWRRVRKQVLTYGLVSAACLVPVLALRPSLVWFAPAFAALVSVNAAYSRWGSERALLNGIASVTMASLMAMIVPVTAGLEWRTGATAAAITWLYLAGTVMHVKAMIREHGSRPHRAISIAYHGGAAIIAAAVEPWLALPFSLMLARTIALTTRPRMRPAVIGGVEIALTVLLLGAIVALGL